MPASGTSHRDTPIQNHNLSQAENYLNKAETGIAAYNPQSVDTDTLMMIANHQKQVVLTMVGSNPETAIALALAQSIEAYSAQLANIQAWTEGGTAVINASTQEIFESLLARGADGFSHCELEDLFQLVLIDMMCNPDNYPGMDELLADPEFMMHMGRILEFTGSGSHKYAGGIGGDPTQLKASYQYIYTAFAEKGLPGEGTFAYKALAVIEANGGLSELQAGMNYDPYVTDGEGWAVSSDYYNPMPSVEATHLSPANLLVVLNFAASSGEISAEDWNTILQGDLQVIDDIIDPNDQYDNIYEYLVAVDPDNWGFQSDGSFNYIPSVGIDSDYLNEIFSDFPERELTDEEIEEINRIGDQVKMLQQTLKYWLDVCRDEQLAIARNI
ncbi:hypothetical protein ACODM8_18730 [Vibrio ostreicida]|nr:hypothetical protein [Vibrio ostreicida]NPD08944.1 hypothetical protein [Vibrio ostreicida]